MSVTKFDIYNYWKDKAITKKFEIKQTRECVEEDKAISIVEFEDSICCWACDFPSMTFDENYAEKSLKYEWNNAGELQKAHICAKSLGGENIPSNLFLLCPICHAESPDTVNEKNFFAWVYYKRKNERYVDTLQNELEKAIKIKNMDLKSVEEYLANLDYEKIMDLRNKMVESCTLHGSFISMASKMMALLDVIEVEQQKEK